MTEECRLCAGEHDEATHAATRRIHEWLRRQVCATLKPVAIPKQRLHGFLPTLWSCGARHRGGRRRANEANWTHSADRSRRGSQFGNHGSRS